MKAKILGLLICLIPAASCNRSATTIVNGTVTVDSLNGSYVYVVITDGSREKAEDSVLIRNNSFRLTLPVDTSKIRSLRIFNHGSAATEDLIFIKEPGILNVVMGRKSKSSGTRLNDILMEWKKGNIDYDSIQYDLYYKTGVPGISDSARDSVERLSALTDSLYLKKVIDIMDRNLDNGIGPLLFGVYYDHLSLETRRRILEQKGKEYMQNDLFIWSKVMFDKEIPKEN